MLEQRTPSSRNRFTGADLDFLAAVLAPGEQRLHLEKLWSDPDARREMLDLKEVLRGLLDSTCAIQVSPRFYFYVLVRHAFLQADLTDPEVADYVAGVMTQRISPSPDDRLQDLVRGFTHASDFVAIISQAHGRMRFHLQVAAGNQFLMLTGLFPTFLARRSEKRGAPDLEFYEAFTRQSFRDASDNRSVPGPAERRLLGSLADAMPTARRSLNRMTEEFVFLGE